jgi:hypothetical protein
VPPLIPFYDGPYTVLQRSLRHFKQRLGNREKNISTCRLQPYTSESTTPTAVPPARSHSPPAAAACHCHTAAQARLLHPRTYTTAIGS